MRGNAFLWNFHWVVKANIFLKKQEKYLKTRDGRGSFSSNLSINEAEKNLLVLLAAKSALLGIFWISEIRKGMQREQQNIA